jgi:DNA-binding XRE family transcriptional regulator
MLSMKDEERARGRITKQVVAAIAKPPRHNTLAARRRALGLSRAALARIFEVDPATVYRQERSRMSAVWDYALRGIEAEAKHLMARDAIKDRKAKLALESTIAAMYGACSVAGSVLVLKLMLKSYCRQLGRGARPMAPA